MIESGYLSGRINRAIAGESSGAGNAVFSPSEISQASAWGIDKVSELSRYEESGLPSRRDEAWKYSNLRQIMGPNWRPENALTNPESHELGAIVDTTSTQGALQIVISDGKIVEDRSDLAEMSEMAEVVYLRGNDSPPQWAKDAFRTCALPEDIELGTGSLGRAFLGEVLAVRIADSVKCSRPIHISHLAGGGCTSAMVLFCVGEGAGVTVIENVSGLPAKSSGSEMMLSALGIIQAARSEVDLATIVRGSFGGNYIGSRFFQVGAEARLRTASLNLGIGFVRQQTLARIVGEHAQADFDILMSLSEDAHSDCLLRIAHDAPDCRSNQRVRAVLRDRSTGAFQGKIEVAPAAQRTDAYQQSDSRLVSDTVSMNVKPELEIFADDVKCSHGSTTGAIDPEHVFYLGARGIPADLAEKILIEAFLNEIIDRNPSSAIRSELRAALDHVAPMLLE